MVVRAAVRFFTTTATHLLPSSHLSIGIHDTQAVRQAGSITLFQGLHHHLHVATQKYGLCLAMYDLGQKSLYYLFLYHFDSLIQVGQIHSLVCSHFTSSGKFCLTACDTIGLNTLLRHSRKPTTHLFSSLWSHLLFDCWSVCPEKPALMIQRQLNLVWLGQLDLQCNLSPLVPEPLWYHSPRVRRIILQNHLYPLCCQPSHSMDWHPRIEPQWTLGSLHWC